jgi:hypothetical protein
MKHFPFPASVCILLQLEDLATTITVTLTEVATNFCRAVEISRRVEGHARCRKLSVLACKPMEHLISPASIRVRGQFKHNATAEWDVAGKLSASRARRAIEIPVRVKSETGLRLKSVGAVRERAEAMQYALGPASVQVRCKLEDHPTASITFTEGPATARARNAVEIPRPVEGQASKWFRSVGAVGEGTERIKDTLGPASVRIRCHFENCTHGKIGRAASQCRAIEISLLIQNQTSPRRAAVGTAVNAYSDL